MVLRVNVTNLEGKSSSRDFAGPEVSIGRALQSDVVLLSPNISQSHLRLIEDRGGLVVIDAGSTNGTYVNGERIDGRHRLIQGERILIGDFVLDVFLLDDEDLKSMITTPEAGQETQVSELHSSDTIQESAADKIAKARALSNSPRPSGTTTPGSPVHPLVAGFSSPTKVDADITSPEGEAASAEAGEATGPDAGDAADIDWEDWEVLKEGTGITGFADRGLIAEVDADGATNISAPPETTGVQELLVALRDCLKRYVAIDERYRQKVYGRSCGCGRCLTCRSKDLI